MHTEQPPLSGLSAPRLSSWAVLWTGHQSKLSETQLWVLHTVGKYSIHQRRPNQINYTSAIFWNIMTLCFKTSGGYLWISLTKSYWQNQERRRISITALFLVAKDNCQTESSQIGRRTEKLQYIHKIKYYTTVKRNEANLSVC